MENRVIFMAGLKKNKGSLAGIAVLLFMAALSLATVLTVWLNGGRYIHQEIQRAGFGNITAWVSKVPDMTTLTEDIEALEEIEKTEVQPLVFSDYVVGNIESDSEGQLIPWMPGEEKYKFFQNDLSGYQAPPPQIASSEIYVSPSMVSTMALEIGETITFPIARGGISVSFTVAGYYEDPFMGSSMIGMKGFLISEADYGKILQTISEARIDALARDGAMIHIFTDRENQRSISQINQLLNESMSLTKSLEFMHSANTIEGFMVILQNAYCGFLAAFVLVLLGVVTVILGHSITGNIEQEYKNNGILKTMGFTGTRLICLEFAQYMAAIAVGILTGMLVAAPLSGIIGQMILTTTGVLLPNALPILPCLAIFGVILVLLAGFTALKLRKIITITPMAAIRREIGTMRWKPGKMFKLRAEGISLKLALRQLMSGKRRYTGVFMIATLLVFFLSMAGRMNAWLGPEGKGMMDAFNPAALDIGVQVLGEAEPAEVERRIQSFTEITDSYLLAMPSVSIEGASYTANVITEPARFHISQGKTCMNNDEIVLTETAASDLGASLGQQVTVQGDAGSKAFTVSGIYHCANDMGANIGMSREGYLSIGQDSSELWCQHYFLEDTSQKEEIKEVLEATYGGDIHVHENSWPGLSGIIAAMQLLMRFMYGMSALFIFIVTAMTGNRLFMAEQKDLGIYKAIGCSVKMLRTSFSLRFGIVAFIGGAVGSILASLVTNPLVSWVMRLTGISNFSSYPTMGSVFIPIAAVVFLFIGFSYLASRRIKKTDINILTAE